MTRLVRDHAAYTELLQRIRLLTGDPDLLVWLDQLAQHIEAEAEERTRQACTRAAREGVKEGLERAHALALDVAKRRDAAAQEWPGPVTSRNFGQQSLGADMVAQALTQHINKEFP